MTLKEWLKTNSMTVTAFSDQIGMDYSAIYRILRGERGVSLEVALVIEYYTGGEVPAASFLTMSPKQMMRLWRHEAKRSPNEERRKRAAKVRGLPPWAKEAAALEDAVA